MRLIDADNLYAVLNNIAAHLFETKSEPQCSMAQNIQYVMGIVMGQPTIAPPPNDPLTLEQLREMDGDPVWTVIDNYPKGGYYCLCDEGVIMAPSGKRFDCKDIPDWIFLRRKPEEDHTDR